MCIRDRSHLTYMLEEIISKKYDLLKPFLDEKSRRLVAAAEALSLGNGNISIVSRATGISPDTIKKGCNELENGTSLSDDKIRCLLYTSDAADDLTRVD